jgi:hypothetical protein
MPVRSSPRWRERCWPPPFGYHHSDMPGERIQRRIDAFLDEA